MIRKLKTWLWGRFLPEYCRQSLLQENARLRAELERQRQEARRLASYIEGMEAGLRAQRRIVLHNTVGKGE